MKASFILDNDSSVKLTLLRIPSIMLYIGSHMSNTVILKFEDIL